MTPVLQPRTMKRADVATNVSPADRPDKPGRMKNQDFSVPLNVRPLDFLAIEGLAPAASPTKLEPFVEGGCQPFGSVLAEVVVAMMHEEIHRPLVEKLYFGPAR